jgi:hypothetical protein
MDQNLAQLVKLLARRAAAELREEFSKQGIKPSGEEPGTGEEREGIERHTNRPNARTGRADRGSG